MKSWRKTAYKIGLILGGALFALQIWRAVQMIQKYPTCLLNHASLLSALGLGIVAYFMQMFAWAVIMLHLEARLKPKDIIQGYMLSFLPRYIPGSIWGYLSRNEWFAQHHDIPYSTSSMGSLLEMSIQMITALGFAVIYMVDNQFRPIIAGILLVSLWLNWWGLPRLLTYVSQERFHVNRNSSPNNWSMFVANGTYLGFWCVHGSVVWLVNSALCNSGAISWQLSVFAMSAAWLTGFVVAIVPTGIGVREATMASLLLRYVPIQVEAASLTAVLSRVILILAEIVTIAIGLLINISTNEHVNRVYRKFIRNW